MKKNGFSLVEMLVVLCVLAITFSIAFPSFSTLASQLFLNASAKALASDLRALQSRAALQGRTLGFESSHLKLPPGIALTKICDLSFSSSGCPPPGGSGTLILQNRFGRSKKIIVSSSGRVRIE